MGFFNARDFKINNPAALGTSCGKCRLHRTCKSPKMKPYGEGEAGLMIIGEAPGEAEDNQDISFVGQHGKYLKSCLKNIGLDPYYDVVKLNAVACRPPNRGQATGIEIEACRGRVFAAIKKYQPKVIIPMGINAMESLIGHRWPKKKDQKESGLGAIERWFNWAIPDRQTKCWIVPNYPVSFILDKKKDTPAAELWFMRSLENAMQHLDIPMPDFKDEESCVDMFTDDNLAYKCLSRIYDKYDFIVFDYESSGLKPYRKGHRIWYIGIAYTQDNAIVFPTQGMPKTLRLFREIMCDRAIRKCAHNMTFEDLWTRERLGVQIDGWILDTIQTAHILDQRPGISGLKFQTYVHTGLIDYSSHISDYLSTPLNNKEAEMGDNKFNCISLAPPKQVMMYCGVDCIGTFRMAVRHAALLDIDLQCPF